MNAVVTVNVVDLLTYLEGPHIQDDSPAPRSHEDSHENRIPNRIQADVCCIVDVSGSMKTKAQSDQYEDASGNMVDDGMTVLDITKHAVKAVMHIPQEDDRLTIVTFRSNANVDFPSTKMCEIGRSTGLDFLASPQPGGTTNIWSGMLAGLEALRACADEGPRQQFLLLLTDGQPDSDDKDHWRKLGD